MDGSDVTEPDAVVTDLDVDYDPAVWIEVPLDFPTSDGESADDWSAALAEEATQGMGDGEARQRIQAAARAVCGIEHPVATRRFWFYPLSGEALSVAHQIVIRREPGDDPVAMLIGDARLISQPVVVELEPVAGERLLRVVFPLPLGGDESGARIAGCVRIARVTPEALSVVEVIDGDLTVIGQMLEHADRLSASLRVERAIVSWSDE